MVTFWIGGVAVVTRTAPSSSVFTLSRSRSSDMALLAGLNKYGYYYIRLDSNRFTAVLLGQSVVYYCGPGTVEPQLLCPPQKITTILASAMSGLNWCIPLCFRKSTNRISRFGKKIWALWLDKNLNHTTSLTTAFSKTFPCKVKAENWHIKTNQRWAPYEVCVISEMALSRAQVTFFYTNGKICKEQGIAYTTWYGHSFWQWLNTYKKPISHRFQLILVPVSCVYAARICVCVWGGGGGGGEEVSPNEHPRKFCQHSKGNINTQTRYKNQDWEQTLNGVKQYIHTPTTVIMQH